MAASKVTPTAQLPKETENLELEVTKATELTETHIISGNAQYSETDSGKGAEEKEQGFRKTLEKAVEFMVKGSAAMKANDYAEAAECFSRALEIRVAHYGELAPECSSAYYEYGCALLYKAQEEVDQLGFVSKKDSGSIQNSKSDGFLSKSECSATSVIRNEIQGQDLNHSADGPNDRSSEIQQNDRSSEIQQTEDDEEDEESVDEGEDESDIDLAWKMLDLARAIVEKIPEDTIEKVDILSTLAEVAVEREDIETSLRDYSNALSMLHRLVESENRQIAEINFRICLVLELDSKPEEAIPYCQNAISVCKARVQRLEDGMKTSTVVADDNEKVEQGHEGKEAEITTINGLLCELEKKLERLQQQQRDSNSNAYLPEFLKMLAAKAKGMTLTSG